MLFFAAFSRGCSSRDGEILLPLLEQKCTKVLKTLLEVWENDLFNKDGIISRMYCRAMTSWSWLSQNIPSSPLVLFCFQLLPVFALMPVNFRLITFNKGNLSFGPEHTEEGEDRAGAETSTGSRCDESEAVDKNENYTSEAGKASCSIKANSGQEEITWQWVWFCIKNYYTAPVNKFIFHLVWSQVQMILHLSNDR